MSRITIKINLRGLFIFSPLNVNTPFDASISSIGNILWCLLLYSKAEYVPVLFLIERNLYYVEYIDVSEKTTMME